MREQFRPEDLAQFAIAGDADFEGVVGGGAGLTPVGLVTVKGGDRKKKGADEGANGATHKPGKHKGGGGGDRSGSGKKHKGGDRSGDRQKKKHKH